MTISILFLIIQESRRSENAQEKDPPTETKNPKIETTTQTTKVYSFYGVD